MATIKDIPGSITDAGSAFDWNIWTTDTVVTLTNVPWDNSYKDIVEFGTKYSAYDSIDSYIDSIPGNRTYRNLAYQDINRPVRIPLGIGYAQMFNYIKVETPAQPMVDADIPRTFYYFITDVRRIAPDTTEIIVQLDVWNTYRKYVSFGNCYLERGHVLMAEKNRMLDHGREFMSVPEGINLGDEYITRSYQVHDIGAGFDYSILVVSTIDWTKPFGTVTDPKLNMATGTRNQNMFNGVNIYIMNVATWQAVASYLSSFPWIEQGIIAIQAVPSSLVTLSKFKKITVSGLAVAGTNTGIYSMDNTSSSVPTDNGVNSRVTFDLFKNWRANVKGNLTEKYRVFDKLFTFPYMQITLSAFNGQPLVLKPEAWNNDNMSVTQYAQVSPPNSRVVWSPNYYNSLFIYDATKNNNTRFFGDFLGQQTGIYNWPTFMMANDGAKLAYASQAHSIGWEYQNADWSQQKALQAASTAASQATNSIGNMGAQNSVAVNARNQQTGVSNALRSQTTDVRNYAGLATAGINGAGSIASSGPSGALSAVGGLMNAGVSMLANNAITGSTNAAASQSANIANAASTASTAISQSGAAYVRDTNKQLADFVANGDYANTVAGINAKVQDLKLTPPSTQGQMGGETFNLAVWSWALVAQVKTITNGAMEILCDYWARFGYETDRYFYKLNDAINVMSKFTYWKVNELYIVPTHSCPQAYLNTVRGIFEKGVTVWNNPEEIGQVDLYSNTPTREDVFFS